MSQNPCYYCTFCGTRTSTQQGLQCHLKQAWKCNKIFRKLLQHNSTVDPPPATDFSSGCKSNIEYTISFDFQTGPIWQEPDTPTTENSMIQSANNPVLIDQTCVVKFPWPVAQIYGKMETRWECLLRLQNPEMEWGGFSSYDEWELA